MGEADEPDLRVGIARFVVTREQRAERPLEEKRVERLALARPDRRSRLLVSEERGAADGHPPDASDLAFIDIETQLDAVLRADRIRPHADGEDPNREIE